MKVKDYLRQVKANKQTYYNQPIENILDFKKQYNYLKKHKEKKVGNLYYDIINKYLNNFDITYIRKYKAMEFIIKSIIF